MQFVQVREGGDVVGLQPEGLSVADGGLGVLAVKVQDGTQVRVTPGVLQQQNIIL